jgi:hypothetical protein
MTPMHPTVTLAELRSLGACAGGLAAFERAFPSGEAPLPDAVSALRRHAMWYAGTSRRPEALRHLAADADANARYGVARNAHTPPDVRAALASDPDFHVARRARLVLEAP